MTVNIYCLEYSIKYLVTESPEEYRYSEKCTGTYHNRRKNTGKTRTPLVYTVCFAIKKGASDIYSFLCIRCIQFALQSRRLYRIYTYIYIYIYIYFIFFEILIL